MRLTTVLKALVGCEQAVPEEVRFEEKSQVIVVTVRPRSRARRRCGICGSRCPGFDAGAGRRRWRHLDAAGLKLYLEADAPRVTCGRHGVVVAAVPWARHDAGHTRDFDQQVAWMATECSKAATAQLMRTSWRTVGAIITRHQADADAGIDRLAGLRRVGIDEISYRRGQKYMTVVVDHDSRRVVWMADGHGKDVLRSFFDALGADRAHRLTHISADGAEWIADVVAERAPNAVRAMDPFHVVAWATEALDEERRSAWNRARREAADPELARRLKHSRHALWKNPEDLTPRQQVKLAWIATNDPRLHRAYLLKEGLRTIYRIAADEGVEAAVKALDRWLSWAVRSRLPAFTDLARKIKRHYEAILHAIVEKLSNGLIESTNTKTRLIIRRGFGFRSAEAVIALVMLCLGGNRPTLPRRQLA
ncbi:ISL3 family transposase [Kitasatospora purpeofusca]|uniref:ISL3 family transposase n=1 Tax=Kitasatospora purpeofusca TaxID=67352 RepID=UPI002259BF86|nr:ISL3 family transposase [Kitasatospora purpeofusca]MCX4756199.1 ISL3 family transposase [Kitasatospora purpeofusca]MCX4757079.1 ISL3 family transposase [Kitasatospora purpeofusca]MCX4758863.1 ISL3 family transposase [Kitasatospora purpeofusca]WSR29587.1 ISL3 family transposase [Kitasatospora purpeofusca]WSR30712.1 ISL3 family transposase [Kitasatospora purpeofusca]